MRLGKSQPSAPSKSAASDLDEGGSSFGNVDHLLKVVGFGMTRMTVSRKIMGPLKCHDFLSLSNSGLMLMSLVLRHTIGPCCCIKPSNFPLFSFR